MVRLWRFAIDTVTQYRQLLLGLYLGKLLLALIVTLPALVIFQSDLDYSNFARPLLREWSMDVLGELVLTKDNVLSYGMLGLIAFGVLALLLKQFLNGGIYDCLVRRELPRSDRFFAKCAELFRANCKITAGMLAVYVALGIVAILVGMAVVAIDQRLFPSQDLLRFALLVVVVYGVMLIGVVYSDYIRIVQTLNPGQPVRASFASAARFFWRKNVQSMSLYAGYFVPFVLLWLAIENLALAVTGGLGNVLGVIIEMILFQICSCLRVWQSLSATLALADFMTGSTAAEHVLTTQEASLDEPTLLP